MHGSHTEHRFRSDFAPENTKQAYRPLLIDVMKGNRGYVFVIEGGRRHWVPGKNAAISAFLPQQ